MAVPKHAHPVTVQRLVLAERQGGRSSGDRLHGEVGLSEVDVALWYGTVLRDFEGRIQSQKDLLIPRKTHGLQLCFVNFVRKMCCILEFWPKSIPSFPPLSS